MIKKDDCNIYNQNILEAISSLVAKFQIRLKESAYWRDVIWQASGNGLAQIIGIIGMPLLTHLYTPTEFALQNLFAQVVLFATGVMTWRYEYFIQLPKEDGDAKYLLRLIIALGIFVFIISTPIIWIYRVLISSWLGDGALVNWIALAPLTALLTCYALALQHQTQRQKQYRQSGISEVVGKSVYVATGVAGYLFFEGPIGLMTTIAFSALAKIIWLFSINDRGVISAKKFSLENEESLSANLLGVKRLAVNYMHLSGSMVFTHIMATCTAAIPAIYIAHAYGGEVLGQFALVISTAFLPAGLIGGAIGQVYYQRAAENWANGYGFADVWHSTAKRLILIGIPIYIVIGIISPWLYPLIFGKSWSDAGRYAMILTVSAFFSFVSAPLERTSLIVGAWWYMPSLHISRVLTTLSVAVLTWIKGWSVDVFLMLYVGQLVFMYSIDCWAGRQFSLRRPVLRNNLSTSSC